MLAVTGQCTFPNQLMAKSQVPVAVGTVITDRPPHTSVCARLRIRLLS